MTQPWRPVRKEYLDQAGHWEYVYSLTRDMMDQWAAAFTAYTVALKAGARVRDAQAAVEDRSPDTFMDALPFQAADQVLAEQSAPLVQAAYLRSGRAEIARLGFNLNFELTNPYARRWAEQHVAQLVTQVSDQTKQAIRSVIVQAYDIAEPPRRSALRIRELVGLTERDSKAVMNYWRTLNEDRTATRADEMADTYARRLHRRRAENIARTETVASSAGGQHDSFMVARDQGLIGPETRREWIAAVDSPRTCELCLALDGQKVGLDEPFPGGYMYPPRHPQCRCAVGIVTEVPR